MAESKTRDFFAWTNNEVQGLLKVTHKYKAVFAKQTAYSNILEWYKDYYPPPQDAMAIGKESPHKRD